MDSWFRRVLWAAVVPACLWIWGLAVCMLLSSVSQVVGR